ncbi:hypothetical protein AMAG_06684 [Allomyces macrogynus ATCC 38327]|uniref:Uncharacterized protein n=1 Tax=Allomyces macrogynus (strain ATCC 38327) TaxID=578462 RepID=A0A0L0SEG5_ALLM3|nr:hypothetical protein AMAG_06684 [Allomyces macrogynus ATCC 38327]|eukprot:KNE60923.1 hypothetical protein AMAG_06684 [Allomyces macrogynus ATCC 38327]
MFNYLDSGEFLSSKNNKYHLVMEPSGNLDLYNSRLWIPPNWIWSPNSAAISSKTGAIVWDIGVRKVPTLNCLFVSDECKIVVSDFFRCEIFRTFDPVMALKHVPRHKAMLACKMVDGVVHVLTKTVPALALLITTAETTTYAMLQDFVNHVAAALFMPEEQRANAKQTFKDAEAEYQRQVKMKRDLGIAVMAMLWFPLVSAGLGIGVAVSTKDVENARSVLDARKDDEFHQRKRYGDFSAGGKKDMAATHLDGLKSEIEELKKQRDQYATIQEFLHKECTEIGLAAGTAQILELETTGYITMMPLTCMLKELVTNLVATGLVEGQDAKKLVADMTKIEAAAEKIKQLKIEGSKALGDLFAPPVEELGIVIPSYKTDFF